MNSYLLALGTRRRLIAYPKEGLTNPHVRFRSHERGSGAVCFVKRNRVPETEGGKDCVHWDNRAEDPSISVPHPFAFFLAKGWEPTNLNQPGSTGARRSVSKVGL